MNKPWILTYSPTKKSILKHAFLWISIYFLFTIMQVFRDDLSDLLLFNLFTVIMYIVAYYSLRYLLIPLVYNKKRPLLFIVSLIISAVALYYSYWIIRINVLEHLSNVNSYRPFKSGSEFLVRTLRFYSPSVALLVWEFQYYKKQDITRRRALEKDKIGMELKFLKAQINPHFLFNSLNNLYSFVVTKSPKAPDMLTRLTGILEYVINDSQQLSVPLSSELETIDHYLELEKIRYGERLKVTYNINNETNPSISPLIILSIIENAFKHGASGDIENPRIEITINAINEDIYCRVWNTKSKYTGELNDEYKKGIGLSNIKKQLALMYPTNHQLKIEDLESSFCLTLTINTNK